MDLTTLVGQIEEYVNESERRDRPFSFVMLTRTPEGPSGKWTLVVSAPWIDREGHGRSLSGVAEELKRRLPRDAATEIRSVTALRTSDQFLTSVTEEIGRQFGQDRPILFHDKVIGGQLISDGAIIRAERQNNR